MKGAGYVENELAEAIHKEAGRPAALDSINYAILIAGQLCGMASRLDVAALEKFLQSNPKDFRYVKQCRAAIEFRRAVDEDLE